ncbi:MAG: 50S ribosomal protein L24 [Pirellulaceae bacterium]|nr:50S ribosomal protein L24 [Pirellulaceae bacterium]
MHLKTEDTVEVIAGADKSTRGKIILIDRPAGKVLVEGVNRVRKHVRRSQKHPQGGRLSKEMPISISNVLLVCPSCGQPTRTGVRIEKDGSKNRFCKKCGSAIGLISSAKR